MRWLPPALAAVLLALPAEAGDKAPARPVLKVGAVASSPKTVDVFRGIRHYFAKHGMPIDYVLYSGYDGLVEALHKGHVDLAWNTPLAHARFHLLAGDSQAVVLRDVDCDYRVKLIVRRDADVASLADLAGKTMVFGSCDSSDTTVLPVHFLTREGVNFDRVKILSLHKEVDARGTPCNSQQHVWQALLKGRGQAGIIGEGLWKSLQANNPKEAALFKELWTSPPATHCVFSARKDFDRATADKFSRLMVAMDGKDELTAEILKLERCSKWVPGGPEAQEGFRELLKALKEQPTLPPRFRGEK
jgi:ABC-type phosphate/phosphonate transport system substrate-binding protein